MSKKHHMRVASHVIKTPRFLGEQDGVPERDFKKRVIPLIDDSGVVERGYLARVSYESDSPHSVALCLRATKPESAIVQAIGTLFASMFGSHQYLDIIFVDSEQEIALARVCSPFFDRIMSSGFYMASSDGYEMEGPRRCRAIKKLVGESRDDYLLMNVDPPLNGQELGLGNHDLDLVVVATRQQGESLFPILRWPVFVHVARLLVSYDGQDVVRNDELENIAWAELYPTEEAARKRAM